MKIKSFILSALLVLSASLSAQDAVASVRIIVKFKNEVVQNRACFTNELWAQNRRTEAVIRKLKAKEVQPQYSGKESRHPVCVIGFPNGTDTTQTIKLLLETNEIEYAEPDYVGSAGGVAEVVPNDSFYFRQWGMKNNGTFALSAAVAGSDIDMEQAWAIEQGDSTLIVAIIDTGNKLDHPDFNGRIWKNTKEIPNNGIDDDKNGYVDDVNGWDFANLDNNPSDDNKHGTNVSGIIGANGNNAIGYAGVDWHCKLMNLKALDKASKGNYSWWSDAIYYAVDQGAKVINMSLGGNPSSLTLADAIDYALKKNVVVVACMMNTNSTTPYYPAACPGVIAVGATGANDIRCKPFPWGVSSGSNFGDHISVVAPGSYIYGLRHTSDTIFNTYLSGTSQATPYVSGLAALLLAQNPTRTPAQIKSIIETTSEDRVGDPLEDTPGWDQYYGHGRINAFKVLSLITSIPETNAENSRVMIYPNPFSEQTNIQADGVLTDATLIVTNALGQTVLTRKRINGKSFVLNRGNLPTGIYTITLTEQNRILGVNKMFIVN